MDGVYILGSGSLAENEEIRYSVRSLALNMLDLGNVFVIGEKPSMLPGAIHVPAEDDQKTKWQNAYKKILMAAKQPEISEEFLLMNDDFFMLEPFNGAEFPFYAIQGSNGGPDGIHSFHVHAPMRIKKEWYAGMPFDALAKGHHSPRTFYGNFYKAPPTFCNDFILRAGEGSKPFNDQVKNAPLFSVGDSAMLYPPFREWLHSMYPDPSRFEA